MKAYIKTVSRVIQYKDREAAGRALPRIRRADSTARILDPSEHYDVLRRTTPDNTVLLK